MAIKLTPQHVGGRVLLSDGDVAWICRFHGEHVSVTGGLWIEFFDLNGAHSAEGSEYRITLLLDAPNPLDVPVPEWCEDVVVWYHDEAIQVLDLEQFKDWLRASHVQPSQGWSPAPGQLPPE